MSGVITRVFTALLFFSTFVYGSGYDSNILSEPIRFISGKTVTLNELLKEKPVYLKFWATWCQPCMKQMPHFQHTQESVGDKVHVLSINLDVNDDLDAVNRVRKKFGLTMPVAMDTSGVLAQAFGLVGTPYHLLLTQQGKLVHSGHEATAELDNKIGLLASRSSVDLSEQTIDVAAKNPKLMELSQEGHAILFFTATWCDWYLESSRPNMSQQCIQAQKSINTLYKDFPNYNWMGVVSRLWTGDTDLKAYVKKYGIRHPITIDTSNEAFFDHKVKNIPTLLVLENGRELFRTSDFDSTKEIVSVINSIKQSLSGVK